MRKKKFQKFSKSYYLSSTAWGKLATATLRNQLFVRWRCDPSDSTIAKTWSFDVRSNDARCRRMPPTALRRLRCERPTDKAARAPWQKTKVVVHRLWIRIKIFKSLFVNWVQEYSISSCLYTWNPILDFLTLILNSMPKGHPILRKNHHALIYITHINHQTRWPSG